MRAPVLYSCGVQKIWGARRRWLVAASALESIAAVTPSTSFSELSASYDARSASLARQVPANCDRRSASAVGTAVRVSICSANGRGHANEAALRRQQFKPDW